MIDDEKFFAWLDGELSPDEAAEVERQVSADPDLSRVADAHRAMQAGLSRAFDQVSSAPVPEKLAAAARAGADTDVVDFTAVRAERDAHRTIPLWQQAAALAATLAIGVLTGNMLSGDSSSPVQPDGDRLVAAAALEDALYTRLASAPAEDGPRIGLTFRDADGNICRTFTDFAASGLACREGGDWRIRGLFQAPEGQGTDYRMAAAADPRLMELVDTTIAGAPFDAAQERAARDRGWR